MSNQSSFNMQTASESYSDSFGKLYAEYRQNKLKINYHIIEEELRSKNITLKQHLTRGPNSFVYIGNHPDKEKPVAIKVMLKTYIEEMGGTIIKRHLAYDKIFKDYRLGRVYEILTLKHDLFCIVTDYFHKGSLTKLLVDANGPLQENVIQVIFTCVLNALNHLHSNRIAHRNLKLENIFIDEEFRPVVADYSHTIIVKSAENFEKLLCTSLPYLAPEILSKIPYDPIISDVWSFGVCLFTVLNNSLPFPTNEKLVPQFVAYQIRPEVDRVLSDEVKQCFRKIFQFDVNKRATSDTLLQLPWFQPKQ